MGAVGSVSAVGDGIQEFLDLVDGDRGRVEVALQVQLAEVDGVAAGVAVFFPAFSTWRAGWGLYLEDLFVRPAYRGQGIGLALFRAVAAEAVARGAERLEWIVLDWNELALGFYRSLGAEALDEWTKMRLTGDALAALAEPVRDA